MTINILKSEFFCSMLRIERLIRGETMEEIVKYDERGNEIYKNSYASEFWWEYDEDDNVIHYRNSNGFERWHEYDEMGNEVHVRDSNGLEKWFDHDKYGNLIYFKDNRGAESIYIYPNYVNKRLPICFVAGYRKPIYLREINGYECWFEYDEYYDVIHYKNSNGKDRWYELDKNGNLLHYKNEKGYEEWFERNEKGYLIRSVDSNGKEIKYTCIESSDKDISVENNGLSENLHYDKNGRLVHYSNSKGIGESYHNRQEKALKDALFFEKRRFFGLYGHLNNPKKIKEESLYI